MFNRNDFALLLLRLGVGLNMMLLHGWQKISGGPAIWRGVGEAMPSFGFSSASLVWGFMAAMAEFLASFCLILGLSFRFSCSVLAFTMIVAIYHHFQLSPLVTDAGWEGASFPLVFLCVYIALFVSGPGKHVLMMKN